jgi:hypothetical protein
MPDDKWLNEILANIKKHIEEQDTKIMELTEISKNMCNRHISCREEMLMKMANVDLSIEQKLNRIDKNVTLMSKVMNVYCAGYTAILMIVVGVITQHILK